ncbi:MAG: YbaB/EbfC family nucleoid-associated protein [Planctomycetota bacterium]
MMDMKTMGKIASLLKNKSKLEAAAQDIKVQLESLRIEGQAGNGAVRAVATGAMKIESVRIDPALAAGLATPSGTDDHAMAESLVTHAVNDALNNAQQAARHIVQRHADELGLGDLGDMGALKNLLPS